MRINLSVSRGYTTRDVARLYRVSEEKVRNWIKIGELSAINTAESSAPRPRYVVTPDALVAFARRRAAGITEVPRPKRKKRTTEVDFYPD